MISGIKKQRLEKAAKHRIRRKRITKILFKAHDLGVPLDNLKRADYYS